MKKKISKMAYAYSEDSDQSGHTPSLIGDFAVPYRKLVRKLGSLATS